MSAPCPDDQIASVLRQMEGLTVALATPLDKAGNLDVAGLERLVERVRQGGAACLFVLGWAGEQPLISDESREAMMRESCRLAGGRLPVMVGVSEQSLPRALEQAQRARAAGANAILSTPPYSYQIPQGSILTFFRGLAADSGLPVVVYQNAEAGVSISEDTLHYLGEIPGVMGVKAYMPYLTMQRSFLRSHRPGRFALMSGDEMLYATALFLGIRHFTMGAPGNLCPGWCTRMYRHALAGEWPAVLEKQKRLIAFCDALFTLDDLTAYATFKAALEHLGICSRRISSPHTAPNAEQFARIEKIMGEFPDLMEATA